MFFRTPRFIRRWIRRRMHPMAEDKAWSMRQKLSVLYAVIAWNAAGYVLYQISKGNKRWPITEGLQGQYDEDLNRPAYEWAKVMGIKKAEVYRMGAGGVKKAYDINFLENKSASPSQTEPEVAPVVPPVAVVKQ